MIGKIDKKVIADTVQAIKCVGRTPNHPPPFFGSRLLFRKLTSS